MQRQLDLFAGAAVGFDAAFAALRRRELAFGAWVDHAPGWVTGHDALFEQLERELEWRTEERAMYDRIVTTPRLLARVPRSGERCGVSIARSGSAGPRSNAERCGVSIVEDMRCALSARYGEELVSTTAALYRDGRDSVAWHGDTTARDMLQAIVATVSLGQPRRFLMKPTEGDASIRSAQPLSYELGRGDLIVMGGSCQRTWRHAVPKVAHAPGPRIALMFRPAWSADY